MAKKKKKKKPVKKKAKKKKKPAKKKMAAKKRPAKKKKTAKKKTAKRKRRKKGPQEPVMPWRHPLPGETFLGVIEDYFQQVGVVALTLKSSVALGDRIHVRGHTTDLIQVVDSMQIEHQAVEQAGANDAVGIKISDKCRAGDYVYRCAS